MMSDVIALVIAYVSIRMSPKNWSKNTYGWARAEVVGALVNAVFLFALCFSIVVEAIKRFLMIQTIENPKLILIVGGAGLLIDVLDMIITDITKMVKKRMITRPRPLAKLKDSST